MKSNILIIQILFLYAYTLQAQDLILSQHLESPILLNPANTGAQHDIRINLNYRQQWRSVTDPFTSMIATSDVKLFSQKNSSSLGLGIFIVNDRAGIGHLNTFLGGLNIASKVPVTSNQNISAGISMAFMQRKIDINQLSWDNQYNGLIYDSNLPTGENFLENHISKFDLSAGVQWSYGKGATTLSSNDNLGAQIGLAIFHINRPNLSFNDNDKTSIRYVIHGTISYGIKNSNMQISPSFLTALQGPHRMFYGGFIVKYKLQESSKYTDYILARMINIGTFYRFGDAIVLSTQLEWGQYAIGISYDINVSPLTKVSTGRGGVELSARYFPLRSSASSRLL